MPQIDAIQLLRAIAALMVVFSHAQADAVNQSVKAGGTLLRFEVLPWDAGVDLFFVISGFIMVHASRTLFATSGAAGTFLARRLIRIVPLYWLMTGIMLAVLGYVALMGKHPFPSLAQIFSSLGFMPFGRPEDGQPRPLVSQGWTLNYEMFFYAVFAVFLRFRGDIAVVAVSVSLATMVGLGEWLHPTSKALVFWCDPIVLEFVLGMWVAVVRGGGYRVRSGLALPLVGIALAILAMDFAGMSAVALMDVDPNGFPRLLGCGVPMTLLFGCLVLAHRPLKARGRVLGSLGMLGDASYALYVFHPLALVGARKAYLLLGLQEVVGFRPLVFLELALAIALALVTHRFVEQPVSKALQRLWHVKTDGSQAVVPTGKVEPVETLRRA